LSQNTSVSDEIRSQTSQLFDAYRRDRAAAVRDRILKLNIRLVTAVVAQYRQPPDQFDDLMQEGTIGLMMAIERYEPSRKTAFATFANHYIRGEINRYLRDRAALVKIPRRWHDRKTKILALTEAGLSDDQIAAHLNLTDGHEVAQARAAFQNRPVKNIDELALTAREHQQFSYPLPVEVNENFVDATALCQQFNKRFVDFYRSSKNRRVITAIARELKQPPASLVRVSRGRHGRTYVHWKIGLLVAQWASPLVSSALADWAVKN
jgi:RNA polymerase sigma factor (sigma-70 family)